MGKKAYIKPKITVATFQVEDGFQLSAPMNGMTENINDYHYEEIGNSEPYYPYGPPMTEGINNGPIGFF